MNIALKLTRNNVFIKRYLSTNRLGRWSIDKNKLETNTIVDWANHDHCGSESCKLTNDIVDETNTKINVDEKKLFEEKKTLLKNEK